MFRQAHEEVDRLQRSERAKQAQLERAREEIERVEMILRQRERIGLGHLDIIREENQRLEDMLRCVCLVLSQNECAYVHACCGVMVRCMLMCVGMCCVLVRVSK